MKNSLKIVESIENIKNFIIKYQDNDDLSIGSGIVGKSLFLYNYSLFFNNTSVLDKSINVFEIAYNQLENNLHNTSLLNGCVGTIWLYLYFCKHKIFNIDNDIIAFFDDFLVRSTEIEKENGNYDLFYGILGYVVYFLEKNSLGISNKSELNYFVDILEEISIRDENGIFWIDNHESSTINLGLAHGIPSIISCLGKIYEITKYEKAKNLGEQGVKWLLSTKKNSKEYYYFENKINLNKTKSNDGNGSRLGWCYGDLGVAHSLISFGKKTGNNLIINEGEKILIKTTNRKADDANSSINDKGFCHGIAGVYYLYKKNHLSFRNDLSVEVYWLDELVDRTDLKSFYSYVFYENSYKYAPDLGLINGFCGIGLVLLSCINKNQDNSWENIFMI